MKPLPPEIFGPQTCHLSSARSARPRGHPGGACVGPPASSAAHGWCCHHGDGGYGTGKAWSFSTDMKQTKMAVAPGAKLTRFP